jgi:Rrf2 family protein
MKLTTKGRYGVTAMYDLALHYGKGSIPLKSIAGRQSISETYLEHLASSLKKAGLIKSTRGAYGGYKLAKTPDKITVGDIVRALEGPIAPVECVTDEDGIQSCEKADTCITRSVWIRLKRSMEDVLDSVTLADLCSSDIRDHVMEGLQ